MGRDVSEFVTKPGEKQCKAAMDIFEHGIRYPATVNELHQPVPVSERLGKDLATDNTRK